MDGELKSYLYRISVLCGALPLLTMTGIFLLWHITGAKLLVLAGLFTITGGKVVALLGLLMIAAFLFVYWREKGTLLRALFAVGLILVNIPVYNAFSDSVSGVGLMDKPYLVTVANDSDIVLDRFTVTGPGLTHTWKKIEPGESRKKNFYPSEGSITYTAVAGEWEYTGTVDYVFGLMGGNLNLRFTSDREFEGGLDSPNWKGPFHEKRKVDSTEGETGS